METKQTLINNTYASPDVRVLKVETGRMCQNSIKGAALQDMQNNTIFEDEDF